MSAQTPALRLEGIVKTFPGVRALDGVSFEVLPVNSVPLARDDAYRGDEDTDIVANVVDNDSDGDGDALTVTLVDGPQHGSLQLDADGGFTYTPTSMAATASATTSAMTSPTAARQR